MIGNNLNIPEGYIFQYCANPFDDEPIMDINTHIGVDPENGEGIIGTQFAREITMLDSMGKKRINIYINSHGGSVKDGYTIFTAIYRCKTLTCGYVGGWAASIAGVILQACDYRIMYSFSHYMVHNPMYAGDEEVTVDEDPILKLIKNSLVDMLLTKNLTEASLNRLMENETYMSPEEAMEYGFVDKIDDINEEIGAENIQYILNNKPEKGINMYKFDLIQNHIKDNIKNNTITMNEKLKKVLNLGENATTADIINAAQKEFPFLFTINAFSKNDGDAKLTGGNLVGSTVKPSGLGDQITSDDDMEVKNFEDETHNMGADMDDCNNDDDDDDDKEDIINLKKEISNLKNELKSIKDSKASDLVNYAVKEGKIKETETKVWLNLAKADYKSAEEALNSMGINKTSNSLLNKIDNEKSKVELSKVKNEATEKAKAEIVNAGEFPDFNKLFTKITKK